MDSNDTPATPEPGTDSRVEDWHGQSVDRDARLADELSEELPPAEAERAFEEQATGRAEQAARHGDEIDVIELVDRDVGEPDARHTGLGSRGELEPSRDPRPVIRAHSRDVDVVLPCVPVRFLRRPDALCIDDE